MKDFTLNSHSWRLINFAVTLLWVYILYGAVIQHPDNYMFASDGDGIKNYYTFAYHVRFDESWTHFGGTNFPHGDHVGYTDGHPIVSLLMGSFGFVQAHPVGTLNILMMLGLVVTSLVSFELLKTLGVRNSIAFIGAFAMAWMNPQMARMTGHFALSHAWIIPLAFLLLIRLVRKPNWMNASYVIALAACAWLFHPYLGAMVFMLFGAFLGSDVIFSLVFKKWQWKRMLVVAAVTVAPVIAYFGFVKSTDLFGDRPEVAKGFLDYCSSYASILVPNKPPLKHLLGMIIGGEQPNYEGFAYIGLATMLVLIAGCIVFFKTNLKALPKNHFWLSMVAAMLAIALFSFGFPFKQGHEEWLQKIPFIQQFRAPGRFAWIVFYVLVALAFVTVERLFGTIIKIPALRVGVLLIVGGLYFVEGKQTHAEISEAISKQPNLFEITNVPSDMLKDILTLNNSSERNEAVILPLPYFYFGSDYIGVSCSDKVRTHAYVVSYHTGRPMLASANPRASIHESTMHMQLLAPSIFEKEIWKEAGTDRPIYVIKTNEPLDAEQTRIYNQATPWWSFAEQKRSYDVFASSPWYSYFSPLTKTEEFDQQPGGRKNVASQDWTILKTFTPEELEGDSLWTASAWMYYTDIEATTTMMAVERVLPDGTNEWLGSVGAANTPYQFTDSLMFEFPFERKPGVKYNVFVHSFDRVPSSFQMDHLQVRPTTGFTYQEAQGGRGETVNNMVVKQR